MARPEILKDVECPKCGGAVERDEDEPLGHYFRGSQGFIAVPALCTRCGWSFDVDEKF